MGALISAAVEFVTNIINGLVTKWMEMRESRKRGEAEAKNAAHEENAKRKAKSDEIMEKPVEVGDDLVDSLRRRSDK